MKNKKFTIIAGIALMAAGVFVLKYTAFPPPYKSIPSGEEKPGHHGHAHDHDHDHEEENIIPLSQEQIDSVGIQTEKAGPGELAVTISTRGRIVLHPDRVAHILPKISGVAQGARKNIGDRVKEGEVLAVLESREMADIKASYLASLEKESLAWALLEREQRLFEKKVSAEQDYLNAKSAYTEAKINLQLSRQKLHAFGIEEKEIAQLPNEKDPDLRLYAIRSPMDGNIIARHINRGEFIDSSETIYEIADLSTIWIEIGIYPKDLVKVKEGQTVDISLPFDGRKEKAKIIYLSPIIQDETITAKAIAELKNPDGTLRPGSFVKVSIATENQAVPIAIPKDAVQEIDGKEIVFVRVPEGFEKRHAKTGICDNETVEIVSGLNIGEEYASSNTFFLKADLNKHEAEHDH